MPGLTGKIPSIHRYVTAAVTPDGETGPAAVAEDSTDLPGHYTRAAHDVEMPVAQGHAPADDAAVVSMHVAKPPSSLVAQSTIELYYGPELVIANVVAVDGGVHPLPLPHR